MELYQQPSALKEKAEHVIQKGQDIAHDIENLYKRKQKKLQRFFKKASIILGIITMLSWSLLFIYSLFLTKPVEIIDTNHINNINNEQPTNNQLPTSTITQTSQTPTPSTAVINPVDPASIWNKIQLYSNTLYFDQKQEIPGLSTVLSDTPQAIKTTTEQNLIDYLKNTNVVYSMVEQTRLLTVAIKNNSNIYIWYILRPRLSSLDYVVNLYSYQTPTEHYYCKYFDTKQNPTPPNIDTTNVEYMVKCNFYAKQNTWTLKRTDWMCSYLTADNKNFILVKEYAPQKKTTIGCIEK